MRAEAAAFRSKKYLCYGNPDRTLWLDIEINIRDTRNSQSGLLLVFQRPFRSKRRIRTLVFRGIASSCFNHMDILKRKKYPGRNDSDDGS